MSYDTITRVKTWLNENIFEPNELCVVYFNDFEYNEQGAGLWVEVAVDPSTTEVSGVQVSEESFQEEGNIIFRIHQEAYFQGVSIYEARDLIVNNLLQLDLYPTGSEKGMIHFYNLRQRQAVSTVRNDAEDPWVQLDFFIAYKKNYVV